MNPLMNPPMNPLVRLTFKDHRAKSEARTALATAPPFLTLGLGLVVIPGQLVMMMM